MLHRKRDQTRQHISFYSQVVACISTKTYSSPLLFPPQGYIVLLLHMRPYPFALDGVQGSWNDASGLVPYDVYWRDYLSLVTHTTWLTSLWHKYIDMDGLKWNCGSLEIIMCHMQQTCSWYCIDKNIYAQIPKPSIFRRSIGSNCLTIDHVWWCVI